MKKRVRKVESESAFLNGVEFRRYPNSKNWADKMYFRPGGSDAKRGVKAYHIELWKFVHGCDVPAGCEIHHIDNNPLNNNVMNLTTITPDDHQRQHGDVTKSKEFIDGRAKTLERIRPLAAKWHSSPDGVEWHSNHGKETWVGRKKVEKRCQVCGVKYETFYPSRSKFCSDHCKEVNRHATKKRMAK